MELPIILEDYINYMKTVRGLSPRTIREYEYDLVRFMRFHLRRHGQGTSRKAPLASVDIAMMNVETLKAVDINDLLAFLAYSEQEEGLSGSRRARMSSAIRSFFKYLVNIQEYFEKNPAEKLTTPKRKKRHPVYLTLEEALRLIEVAAKEDNPFFRTRDVAIVVTFLTTGMRLSELCGLNITSLREGRFHVVGKGNKERVIYLTESCEAAIRSYLSRRPIVPGEDALFLSTHHQRISPRAVQHRMDALLREAGFDTSIYSTHKLRHTAATLMYREGVDIRTLQRILGHESLQTTQIYTHVEDEMARDAVSRNPLAHLQMTDEKSAPKE